MTDKTDDKKADKMSEEDNCPICGLKVWTTDVHDIPHYPTHSTWQWMLIINALQAKLDKAKKALQIAKENVRIFNIVHLTNNYLDEIADIADETLEELEEK